ncbi:alpha/beta hydrolase [Streptomyces sp. NPDC088847]|uniref:alpha/beta hydrolase n=1 Tax=Streptomyces sp. NPDC088847 TaxID=3365909 RepID=UPI0037F7E083
MTTQQRDAIEPVMRSQTFDPSIPVIQRRADFAAVFASRTLPPGVTSRTITLGGRPAIRVEPAGARRNGTLLYLHGGGYIAGSAETGQYLAASLARRAGVVAVSLDYRLAPEHPYPAAVEDAVAAYRDLLATGTRPRDVVVAGDSAGGGLTIALLLASRALGLELPSAAVVFSPFVDLALTGESVRSRSDLDTVLTPELLKIFAAAYLNDIDPRTPLASPLYADLSGLPPILVQGGTHEILLSDATRLAQRAVEAEVDVTMDIAPGMTHVFQSNEGRLNEADDALERAGAFLRHALSPWARTEAARSPA